MPKNIPKVVIVENRIKNFQSTFIKSASPNKNPNIDFNAIITRDVPIAFFISKFVNNIIAGTIKNPPPAQTKPVSNPTSKPSKIIKK